MSDLIVIKINFACRGSLNNYLVWKLVQKFLPYLSKAYTEVVDLYRKHLTGAQKPPQRWEFCADTTQGFFGHLMDSLLFQSQVNYINDVFLSAPLKEGIILVFMCHL